MGPAGPPGAPAPALGSFEDLAGLPCTAGGQTGSISIGWDSASHAVISCSAPSGGGPVNPPVLRINEFMTGTAASGSDEFVEVVNAGESAADVGGYRVVYRSAAGTSDVALATIPAGTTIAAGGFYLLGGSAYGGVPAAQQSFSAGLAASGGGLGLRDGSGALVDSVGYGGTTTNAFVETAPAPAPAAGSSAARMPNGHDTNDNAADFTVDSTPTPGATNG